MPATLPAPLDCTAPGCCEGVVSFLPDGSARCERCGGTGIEPCIECHFPAHAVIHEDPLRGCAICVACLPHADAMLEAA